MKITHYRFGLLILILFVAFPASSQISCGRGAVSSLACSDADVRALITRGQEVVKLLGCKNEAADELRLMMQSWGRDQYRCEQKADVKSCLVEQLSSEIGYLESLRSCDIPLPPVLFRSVDPAYVLRHAEIYENRKIEIVGRLRLFGCKTESPGEIGEILGSTGSPPLPARIPGMTIAQHKYVCEKEPTSAWLGVLKIDGSVGPVFMFSDAAAVPY